MESVYAALLLHKAAKKVDEKGIEKVLTAAGVEVDKNQLKALVAGLEGKNIDELIAGASAAPVAAAPSAAPAAAEKKGKKKEKKKEEKKEEEPAGLGALFG
ncbi:50S ribosomal protein P1 [Promethearchaeum syntrophicum]|uniref:Large ribosomal subunit protein P1 n=1 Tax=Promethearchaeum syntrophicum TaxID=2594042 RepID=A0A5B9DAD7_9ARCH|nr:50S ribosomal protein P1 [Candidatus Prometheoarchaeum syntrophicum]QEE15961.1 50S ribosomal protein L12 [Candidatus Prometheoarchaeum syntrophicum]